MADQKISELTALTGANVADDDAIAIVDTSATETKKIVFSELKNALDTATGFVRITGDTMTGDLNVLANVGIGTSSPTTALHVLSGTGNSDVAIFSGSNASRGLKISTLQGGAADEGVDFDAHAGSTAFHTFSINGSEAMRIDSSGNVLVGKTSIGLSTTGIDLRSTGLLQAIRNGGAVVELNRQTSDGTIIDFRKDNATVGSISVTGSATAYNTSSDHRLKENVVELTGATERLKQLNPSRFNFIADAETTVDGFLAHEVQSVVPEAITGTKDAMRDEEYEVTPAVLDDDGNVVTEAVMGTRSVPDYQGIDQSKLVPLLVATIKELEARITALENA